MANIITLDDQRIVLQQSGSPYGVRLKIEVISCITSAVVGIIYGTVSGTFQMNSESDVRRTMSLQLQPSRTEYIKLEEDSLVWLDKDLKFYCELYNARKKEWISYPLGWYTYTNASINYDQTNNQLTINASDYMVKLDGTKNGQVGSLSTSFPAYDVYRYKGSKSSTGDLPSPSEQNIESALVTMNDVYRVSSNGHYYKCNQYYDWEDIGTDLDNYISNGTGTVVSESTDYGTAYYRYNILRETIIKIIETFANIKNYSIEEIGAYNGFANRNANWQKYRDENPTWNVIPYDQEFDCGATVLSMLTTFRDLYPGFEMFFDMTTNDFVCQQIPMCYEDDIYLYNDFFQKVIISENTTIDLSKVRNVTEVWGTVFSTDFYSKNVSYSGNVYSATLSAYDDDYKNGDVVSLKVPSNNSSSPKMNLNGYGEIPILYEDSLEGIEAGKMIGGKVYTFKIVKKRKNKTTTVHALFLGQWQVHALCVITDGSVGEMVSIPQAHKSCKKYSLEYFKAKYSVDVVEMNVLPNSPYTVQKLGELLDVKSGGDYEDIPSDDLALVRAHWENWKTARLTDEISIKTLMLPWLEVNKKVTYQTHDMENPEQYVIKTVSHDFKGFTSTIALYRFYPEYES